MKKPALTIGRIFELFLWNFRLVVLLAVLGLLMASLVVFLMGIFDAIDVGWIFVRHLFTHGIHMEAISVEVVVHVVTLVDDFLLGVVLMIIGLGLYDLFISRIDPALEQDDIRPDWIVFSSLEELKGVLGKVVLMIMTINFLRYSSSMEFEEPQDLLMLAGGISLLALAMKLSHSHDTSHTSAHGVAKKVAAAAAPAAPDAEAAHPPPAADGAPAR